MASEIPLTDRLELEAAAGASPTTIDIDSARGATCANCGHASQHVLDDYNSVFLGDRNRDPERKQGTVLLQLWGCRFCHKSTVLLVVTPGERTKVSSLRIQQVWPEKAPRQLADEAPGAVRSLYQEASIAESAGALRGAAVLYRAAVEELVNDRKAEGDNLKKKIDDLASRGASDDLVRDLHEARVTGNFSIHQGIAFDAAELSDVAKLIREAVEELYVMPARKEAMREARAKRRAEKEGGRASP